jgi:hypothetical protein
MQRQGSVPEYSRAFQEPCQVGESCKSISNGHWAGLFSGSTQSKNFKRIQRLCECTLQVLILAWSLASTSTRASLSHVFKVTLVEASLSHALEMTLANSGIGWVPWFHGLKGHSLSSYCVIYNIGIVILKILKLEFYSFVKLQEK